MGLLMGLGCFPKAGHCQHSTQTHEKEKHVIARVFPQPYFLRAAFAAAGLDLALPFALGTELPSVSRFGFGAFGANFLATTHVNSCRGM